MILEIKVDLESLDLEEDESLSEKIKEQVIKKVVDTLSDKIKCKPEKRLTIEIHPEPIDMGVKVGYSYHDENKKNGRFREFGISNAKDLAGIDKLLIEYFGKADPNP